MIETVMIVIVLISFCALVCIGALVAWLCGCDVNEPEYYEHKQRKQDNA